MKLDDASTRRIACNRIGLILLAGLFLPGKVMASNQVSGKKPPPKPAIGRVILVNMSGKSRQAHLGNLEIDLPVAHPIMLQFKAGETLHVVSNPDSRLDQHFVISPEPTIRVVTIR